MSHFSPHSLSLNVTSDVDALIISNLSVHIPPRGDILCDLSFQAPKGDILSLMGPNGGGKTTLCQALTNQSEGRVRGSMRVQLTNGQQRPLRSHDWCYLPQRFTGDRLFPLHVVDFLKLSFPDAHSDNIEACLDRMKLGSYRYAAIQTLSEGQFQRLLLVRMCLHSQPIMILDEPFAGLDETMIAETLTLFQHWATQGRIIIVAHHNRQRALKHFQNTLIVAQKTHRWGPSHEVLDPEVWTALHETVSRMECC